MLRKYGWITKSALLLGAIVICLTINQAQDFAPLTSEPVRAMAWNPAGTLLAVGNPKGQLLILDTEGREIQRWPADATAVAGIAWSLDGKLLATSGEEGSIRYWDTETWRLVREFGHYSYGASYLSWSTDSSILIGSGFDTFQVWDANTGEPLTEAFSISLDGIKWRPNSENEFAYLHYQEVGTIRFVDGKLEAGIAYETYSGQFSRYTVDWSLDGTRLIVAGKEDAVRVWDGDSGELLAEIPAREHFIQDITFVSETQAIGVTLSGEVVLVDLEEKNLAVIAQFDARLMTMAWNPQIGRLALGGFTGSVTATASGEVRDVDGFLDFVELSEFIQTPETQ